MRKRLKHIIRITRSVFFPLFRHCLPGTGAAKLAKIGRIQAEGMVV
jgi:hypothetical protein